jgi:lysophospholipase L1-like esterase
VIIYNQTQFLTATGTIDGYLTLGDVSNLAPGARGVLSDSDSGPTSIKVESVNYSTKTIRVTINDLYADLRSYTPAAGGVVYFAAQSVAGDYTPIVPGADLSSGLVTVTGSGIARPLSTQLATLPDTFKPLGRVADVTRAFAVLSTRRFDFTPRQGSVLDPFWLAGDQGEKLTFTRASDAWVVDFLGTLQHSLGTINSQGTLGFTRQGQLGLLIERAVTNIISTPTAPVNETITVNSAVPGHTAWFEGTGHMTIAAGTATATGLPLVLTGGGVGLPGAPGGFTVTGNGTITVTYDAAPSYASIEKSANFTDHATSKILTGSYTRVADAASMAVDLGGRWAVDIVLSIEGKWWASPANQTRGFWSFGVTGYNANEANLVMIGNTLTFYVADSAGAGRSIAITVPSWADYSQHRITCVADVVDGSMALYLDGIKNTTAVTGAGTGKWSTKPTVLNIGRRAAGEEGDLWVHSIAVNQQSWSAALVNSESPTAVPLDLAVFGDSRSWAAAANWQAAYGSSAVITNEGWSGDRTAWALTRWTARVRAQRHRVLVIQIAINDFGNDYATGAQAWTNVQTVIDQAVADGTQVILETCLPFRGASYYSDLREVQRQAFNSLALAYGAANPRITVWDASAWADDGTGQLRAVIDSGDRLHLSSAGNDAKVAALRSAVTWLP